MSDDESEFTPLKYRMRFPRKIESTDEFVSFLNDMVVLPYRPTAPVFDVTTSFISLGSCFSTNVAKTLGKLGFDVTNFIMSERLFTSFALRDFISTVSSGDVDLDLIDDLPENEAAVSDVARRLDQGSTVILTLGLSVCWFHRETGAYRHTVDPRPEGLKRTGGEARAEKRILEYEMRPTSVEENVAALDEAIAAIKAKNPANKVILSVSPIPLMWHQSDDIPILTADFISKSTLMFAVQEIMRKNLENVHYFPSFEIVRWGSPHFPGPMWGTPATDGDARHLDPELIRLIMMLFMTHFGDVPQETRNKI